MNQSDTSFTINVNKDENAYLIQTPSSTQKKWLGRNITRFCLSEQQNVQSAIYIISALFTIIIITSIITPADIDSPYKRFGTTLKCFGVYGALAFMGTMIKHACMRC